MGVLVLGGFVCVLMSCTRVPVPCRHSAHRSHFQHWHYPTVHCRFKTFCLPMVR